MLDALTKFCAEKNNLWGEIGFSNIQRAMKKGHECYELSDLVKNEYRLLGERALKSGDMETLTKPPAWWSSTSTCFTQGKHLWFGPSPGKNVTFDVRHDAEMLQNGWTLGAEASCIHAPLEEPGRG